MVNIPGCLDPDLDLVSSVANRGDDDLLARLTVDDEDLFVNAAGQSFARSEKKPRQGRG